VALVVLDTDIVSDLMRPRPAPQLVERLAQTAASGQATTAITIGELAYGARRVDRPELYERAMHLLSGVTVLPFDRDAAERYGSIRSELERAGRRLPDPDLRIAATTLAHGAVLITGNIRHFERISGLACEDWLRG
jgi:tRNA(fMet)-specific endonuclease VapC